MVAGDYAWAVDTHELGLNFCLTFVRGLGPDEVIARLGGAEPVSIGSAAVALAGFEAVAERVDEDGASLESELGYVAATPAGDMDDTEEFDDDFRQRTFALMERITGVRWDAAFLAAATFRCAGVAGPGSPAVAQPWYAEVREALGAYATDPADWDDESLAEVRRRELGITDPRIKALGDPGMDVLDHGGADLVLAIACAPAELVERVAVWARERPFRLAGALDEPWFAAIRERVRRREPLSEAEVRLVEEGLDAYLRTVLTFREDTRSRVARTLVTPPEVAGPAVELCALLGTAATAEGGWMTRVLDQLRADFPELVEVTVPPPPMPAERPAVRRKREARERQEEQWRREDLRRTWGGRIPGNAAAGARGAGTHARPGAVRPGPDRPHRRRRDTGPARFSPLPGQRLTGPGPAVRRSRMRLSSSAMARLTTVIRNGGMTDNPNHLVIGGTGKTGRRVVDRLRARGLRVTAGSRAGRPAFDWHADPETWTPLLRGVTAAYVTYHPDLAFPGAAESIRAFAEIAEEAGVRRLVLLSGRGEEEAEVSEQGVRDSGLQWTVVRSTWFAQDFTEHFLLPPVLAGVIALPTDAPEPFVDLEDVADVVVAALTEDGHHGRTYELTGPRPVTFAEAAELIAAASGRPVRFERVTVEECAARMTAEGVPADEAAGLAALFARILDGRNARTTDDVKRVTGHEARDFRDFVRGAAATGVWSS